MGYTTEFKGRFDIAPKLALDTYQALVLLADERHEGGDFPGYYCQWIPTKDGLHIEWDGNEKFYDYVEWLHYIVDNILIPGEYILSGSVQWQGDEVGDAGTISVVNNQITEMKADAQVTGLKEQLAEFKSIADKFRGLNAEKSDEIDLLKKQLAYSREELADALAHKPVGQLIKKHVVLEAKLAAIKDENLAFNKVANRAIAELADTKKQLADMTKLNDQNCDTKDSYKKQLCSVKEQLAAANAEIAELKRVPHCEYKTHKR